MYSCSRKRLAQATDDRSKEIAVRGTLVLQHTGVQSARRFVFQRGSAWHPRFRRAGEQQSRVPQFIRSGHRSLVLISRCTCTYYLSQKFLGQGANGQKQRAVCNSIGMSRLLQMSTHSSSKHSTIA